MSIYKRPVVIAASLVIMLLFSTGAFYLLSSEPSKYENRIVKKIEMEGLVNVDADDLEETLHTAVDYPLKSDEVRDDIKRLFATGRFKNVSVEIDEFGDGVAIKFIFEERPVIEKIVLKGNDEIIETDLLELMMLKENDVYREELVESSIGRISEKYDSQGYFSAYITYRVREGSDKNSVLLDIIIDEGEEIKVRKITILGANKIYTKELYQLMETKEDSLFTDGAFKAGIYEDDKRKIIGYYQQEGYLDAQIVDEKVEYEWVDPDKKNERCIYIVLKLYEGEKYYFDGPYTLDIKAGEGQVISLEELENIKSRFMLKENGEVFNNSKYMNDKNSVGLYYASKGYIFAGVVPEKTITEKEVEVNGKKEIRKYVKINFRVEERNKAYVEQIIIKGNKKTKDRVIRRELAIKEGEIFDAAKMQISREKVYNLGFFKQVDFDVRPGTKDGYMNLIVDVEEQPSGTLSLGGGYGSNAGFSIFADITENNFLGNGQTVGVKFEYGPEKTSITLSFQERWLFDKPLGFSSSIFYYIYNKETTSMFPESDDTATYKLNGIGYSLGLSYRYWYYFVSGSSWVHTFKTYTDPSGNCPDEVFMYADSGGQEKRTLKLYTFMDSKNNYLNPTRGIRTGMSVSFTGGGLLRGDDHFIQYSPEFYAYYSPFHLPFLESHPTAIEFRVSADFIKPPLGKSWVSGNQNYEDNEWVESDDRLDIGGPETVRGWDYYDSDLPDSWSYVGLYHRILYGAEFRVPLHPEMLWAVAFFDAGALWSDKFWEKQLNDTYRDYVQQDLASGRLKRIDDFFDTDLLPYFIYSYGFGIKVQIPMMPLRFWFGKKMIYDDGFKAISGYNFQFGIGDMRF
ncbi:MAG: outer membrane protein assembly factor BamA [Spirochaetes bacterium]|nr:outer membrane protein assembly factor BamA [Spirochaetota bacterium]